MLRHRRAAILFSIVAVISSGCAYQLKTGYRDLDGGCHCLENLTAPVVRACAWTGELLLGGAAAASSVIDDDCQDGSTGNSRGGKSQADQSGGDDSSSSAPQGKPLR